jgi:uncharacterized protein YcaQ
MMVSMANILTLSPTIARRLATAAQLLDSQAGFADQSDKERIITAARQIRCLQIDPINVVARSPLLVLWSRIGPFDVDAFGKLLWDDRMMFEYWAHAASLVLSEDFPIFQLWMGKRSGGDGESGELYRQWLATNEPFRQYILSELQTRGPLFVEEIEDRAVEQWQWGNWADKEATRTVHRMIEALWDRGLVTVTRREGQGFGLRKQWGLMADYLPEWVDHEPWGEEEVVRAAIQRSLNALGVARPKHIKRHFTRDRYPGLPKMLRKMTAEEQISRVQIASDDPAWAGEWIISPHAIALLESGRLDDGDWGRTVLLSPFDNLICDRARTEEMWGFFYRSEIYTPKAKRQYGYYTMPILHGEQLIGRLDPAMDRKNKLLNVHALHLEPGVEPTAEIGAGIAQSLRSLAEFLGATEIVFGEDTKKAWLNLLG